MLAVVADAQQLRQEAFELINLDYPGLEKVKAACSRQKWEAAAQELKQNINPVKAIIQEKECFIFIPL